MLRSSLEDFQIAIIKTEKEIKSQQRLLLCCSDTTGLWQCKRRRRNNKNTIIIHNYVHSARQSFTIFGVA